jgi:hypothetical protein
LVTFKTAKNGKSCQMRELLTFCPFSGTALFSMKHKIDEFDQPDHVLARLVIAIKLLLSVNEAGGGPPSLPSGLRGRYWTISRIQGFHWPNSMLSVATASEATTYNRIVA